MARPVTLFTGQWADLPLEDTRRPVRRLGLRRAELACWGDHFDVDKALRDPATPPDGGRCSSATGCGCWAIGNHLVGQAVCDPIDDRHQAILPPEVWGDGDPEGVRERAPSG